MDAMAQKLEHTGDRKIQVQAKAALTALQGNGWQESREAAVTSGADSPGAGPGTARTPGPLTRARRPVGAVQAPDRAGGRISTDLSYIFAISWSHCAHRIVCVGMTSAYFVSVVFDSIDANVLDAPPRDMEGKGRCREDTWWICWRYFIREGLPNEQLTRFTSL